MELCLVLVALILQGVPDGTVAQTLRDAFYPSPTLVTTEASQEEEAEFNITSFQQKYDSRFEMATLALSDMISMYTSAFCNYFAASVGPRKVVNIFNKVCKGSKFYEGPKPFLNCVRKYFLVYKRDTPTASLMYSRSGKMMIMYQEEQFVSLCLPVFRKQDICIERKYMTFCLGEMMIFMHSSSCSRPSEADNNFEFLLAKTSLVMDYKCFQAVCDGNVRVIDRTVHGISVLMMRYTGSDTQKCYAYLENVFDTSTVTIATNLQFPCCYPLHTVVWIGDPVAKGLNVFWDYLPFWCRAGEITLIALIGIIGVAGTLGNILVLAVLPRSKKRDDSIIIRSSLAVSDLLSCVFVIVPSFFDHLEPIQNYSNLRDRYAIKEYVPDSRLETNLIFTLKIPVTEGYRVFQGLLFGVCSMVSLHTLFILSLNRLFLVSLPSKYQLYFNKSRIVSVIALIWTLSIFETLLLMFDGRDGLCGTWSTMAKLPLANSFYEYDGSLKWISYSLMALLGILCVATTVLSLVSLCRFPQKEARTAKEFRVNEMRVSGAKWRRRENRYVMETLALMSALFVAGTASQGLRFLFSYIGSSSTIVIIIEYVGWWSFLASSAWNPWVYNMRQSELRHDAALMLKRLLPTWLLRRLERPREAGRKRERRHEKMLGKLGLPTITLD